MYKIVVFLTIFFVVSTQVNNELDSMEYAEEQDIMEDERLLENYVHQNQAILNGEQVSRLVALMNETVSIYGQGNFPVLQVRLIDLINNVRLKLEAEQRSSGKDILIGSIKLNGGAASHVLSTDLVPYNDLDLIFEVDLEENRMEVVRVAVLSSLIDLMPDGVNKTRLTTYAMQDAYVSKRARVNDPPDLWSLLSLGYSRAHPNIELKFVHSMLRPFEFSVDSFQIILDPLLLFYRSSYRSSKLLLSEYYPTIKGESMYGRFYGALYHLDHKLIATYNPEEIRGGGLLKYVNLVLRGYTPANPESIKGLEFSMCQGFVKDFIGIQSQKKKIAHYLYNHIVGGDEAYMKLQFLTILHRVVSELSHRFCKYRKHEMLCLIKDLGCQIYYQQLDFLQEELAYNGPQSYLQEQLYNEQLSYPQEQLYNEQPSYPQEQLYSEQPSHPQERLHNEQPSHPQEQLYNEQPSHPQEQLYNEQPSHPQEQLYNEQPSHPQEQLYNEQPSYPSYPQEQFVHNEQQSYPQEEVYNEPPCSRQQLSIYYYDTTIVASNCSCYMPY